MAPKFKIETQNDGLDQLAKRGPAKRAADDQDCQQEQAAAKRPAKTPLNFSIESIMQPSQQANHQSNSPFVAAKRSPTAPRESRSPSPASDAGSRSSSRSSASTLASGNSENGAYDEGRAAQKGQVQQIREQSNGNHLSNLHPNLESNSLINDGDSFVSSNASSRVSSPISPGRISASGATNEQSPQAATAKVNLSQSELAFSLKESHLNGDRQIGGQHQAAAPHQAGTSSGPKALSSTKSHRSGHSSNSRLKPVCTDSRLAPFECHLDNLDLWHRFHPLDTEMIITKQGRRMFPPVRVTFSFNDQLLHQQQAASFNQPQPQQQLQLNSRDRYQVLMDILPYDNKRWRYAYHKSSWQQAGKADPPSPTKLFLHPDGPFTLDQLKRQVISFEKIKLTNNDENKHGYIVLNSMHKYQPRIHLILWRGKESQNLANAPVSLLEQEAHKTFIFSETIFTAVTAYQNHSITKLKIDSNPFAKGFRDSTRLTDLELESMQDLIADGQCPFSPPRAPPPGFPHFLFAAAQNPQQFNGSLHPQQSFGPGHPPSYQFGAQMPPGSKQPVEDTTAALLRERTIMALDSFLQQQQQQQQQQSSESPNQFGKSGVLNMAAPSPSARSEHLQGGSPTVSNSVNCGQNKPSAMPPTLPPTPNQQYNPAAHFANAFLASEAGASQQPPPPPYPGHAPSHLRLPGSVPVPSSQAQGQLEQFILQQQQQFAAAMAAAAASGVHQHPAYLQSLFAQAAAQQCQAPPPAGSTTPKSQTAGQKLDTSSVSPPAARQMTQVVAGGPQQHSEQTSPIGLAKSANRLQLELNQFLGHPLPVSMANSAGASAGPHPHQLHPKQLQAIMQQQQQQQQQLQQMAAMAQQQHHLSHHHHLQMEPLVALQDAGMAARRAAKNK